MREAGEPVTDAGAVRPIGYFALALPGGSGNRAVT